MPQSWNDIQRARKAQRTRVRNVEQDAAQTPEIPPSSTIGETLFQAGQEGALPFGLAAIPQGALRMALNAPYGFTRALSGLQQAESPGEIAQGVVSNVLANPEGVIAKGKFFGRDVEIKTERPERISLDDVLRAGGIPEFGRPSDVPILGLAYTKTGKGLPLREEGILDPSVRGVAGFIGETAASPLAHLKVQGGPVVGVARNQAGKVLAKVRASKAGQAAFNAFRNEILQARFGPAAKAAETTMSIEAIEEVRDAAATRLFEAAQKSPQLLEKAALYLGPVRLGGTRVIDAASKLRSRVAARLNTFEPWRKVTEKVAAKAQSLERLWSVVPAAARRYPMAEEDVSRFFADRRNITRESRENIRSWMKGLDKVSVEQGPHKGMPLDDYVRHSIDNPAMYPDTVLPPAVRAIKDDIRAWEDDMFRVEAGFGLRDPAQARPNYLQHRYYVNGKPITRAQWEKLGGNEAIQHTPGVQSATIGGSTMARTFPTYDEALQKLNQRAQERGLKMVVSPAPLEESLLHRAYNHADAVAFARLEGRFLRDFGIDAAQAADEHFATILPEISNLLTAGELRVGAAYQQSAQEMRDMLFNYAGRAGLPTSRNAEHALKEAAQNAARFQLLAPSKALLNRIKRTDNLTKAFYWISRLKTAATRSDFEQLLLDRPGLGDLDDQLVKKLTDYIGVSRETWTNKMRDQFGEALVQWKGRTKPMWLPGPLADELQQLSKTGAIDEDLMAAMNIYDTATTLYKGLVTSHVPSFNARNAYSNLATSYLELGMTAANPLRRQRSLAILRGGEGTIQSPTGRYSYSQLRDAARQYGILNEQDFALEGVGGLPAHSRILNLPPFRLGRKVGTGIENWDKMALMLGHVERGASLEAAAWRTQQVLFDYDYLSNFARQHVRRIFPFSTWYLKTVSLTPRLLATQPGRVYKIERFNEMQHADRAPDNDALPDYLRGRFHLRTARKGETTFWYGLDLPHRAFLDNVYKGDNSFFKTLKANAAMLHPALKAVAAASTGHDPVTEQSIYAPKEVREGWANIMRALPQDTQDALEFVQRPDGSWQMNGTKAYLFFNVLAADRILWPVAAYGEAKKKDYDVDNALLDIALGINTETLDLTEVQRRLYNRRLREAEDRLIRAGKRRRINITIENK